MAGRQGDAGNGGGLPPLPSATPHRPGSFATREQMLIDWAEYQQEAMSRCVCDLAHAVRQASGGRKLVVFFYGYIFEFSAVPTGPSVAGHYALRRVLDSAGHRCPLLADLVL